MGSICASTAKGGEELASAQADPQQSKSRADDYRARLMDEQNHLQTTQAADLPTEPSLLDGDLDRLHSLLQTDLEEGWRLIRMLEQVIETPRRFEADEHLKDLDLEQVENLLHNRSTYARSLVQRLLSDSAGIKDLVASSWMQLATHYRCLKKAEDLVGFYPKHTCELTESLNGLLRRYETLAEEYVHLAAAASGAQSTIEIENLQLDLRAVESRKAHCADILAKVEIANRGLLNSSISAKGELQQAEAESDLKRREVTEAASELEELGKRVTELEDDLTVKRELLVHMKEELGGVSETNKQLQQEVARLKSLQSKNEIAAEMTSLENEKRLLVQRVAEMEGELAIKQSQISSNKKKLAQLEDALRESEERVSNTGDIDVRMLNMQSTLRELYKSIEDTPDEELDDDLD